MAANDDEIPCHVVRSGVKGHLSHIGVIMTHSYTNYVRGESSVKCQLSGVYQSLNGKKSRRMGILMTTSRRMRKTVFLLQT